MTGRINSISTILAVWNGMPYLPEAIESVLTQTLPPDEVIVVDDGSTDETPTALEGFAGAIRVITQPRAGQAAALAAGIAVSSGAYLTFQDADDLWAPQKTELQFKTLEENPALDAIFGLSEQFVSPELGDDDQRRFNPARQVLTGELAQCTMLRRTVYDRYGGFDPMLSSAWFVDWLGKAKQAGMNTATLDQVVHRRRLHPANFGRLNAPARDRQLLATLRHHIARGRSHTKDF